jgi:hypothetical protein
VEGQISDYGISFTEQGQSFNRDQARFTGAGPNKINDALFGLALLYHPNLGKPL